MAEVLKTDRPAPSVRVLTLNRPDALNAMTAELCEALHEELRSVAADRSCRVVVLTGAGRAFCAGVDLRGYGDAPGNDGTDAARDMLGNQEHMSRLILHLRATPQPIIAAVNGGAAGIGLALKLASDIRYAAPQAGVPAAVPKLRGGNQCIGASWLRPRPIGAVPGPRRAFLGPPLSP